MTFNITSDQFQKLFGQLLDSKDLVVEPTANDLTSGTITHDNVKASYSFASNVLTVNVTQGGNFLVNHVIHSKVQAAIDSLGKS
jgi:hypothetical protein